MLCRGLGNPDIELDLLSEMNHDMTLEPVFMIVEAKGAGKFSATFLLATWHTANALSKRTYFSNSRESVNKALHPTT